ncbi:MobV family relaxase, partial [Bacteroides ovatus]
VTHLNVVLTGSHKEMTAIGENPERLTQWMNENYRFVSERFGGKNVVDFTLHMDERTPHIHCVVVPLTKDGRLSAKEVMGDRRKLSELQDCYGKAMQNKFGLQRGIKGSTATHDSVREYYARINECMSSMANEGIKIPEVFITPPQINIPPLMGRENWAKKQNQAIYKAFSSGAKDILQKIQKRDTAQIRDENNSKMKLTEANQRLKKENAQLHAIIKRQDKELHPERYIKTDKGYSL